ncbi:hypothetical protein GWI33_007989 [Rhynchophorus ferrugineus]|uniref:Coiled-coil domain-containing protein 137 n=1 Tax=Rhynchophorus ferrugineus TaxID=354439 RepID=A0A834MBF9_RHYFE|nr:hypothetical protein GWI33_007989 [Rhynchophorus ferrugineus]
MGRKIPGRKHRGIRDPEKQSAERFAKIKDKINAPPTNPDEQQISNSLLRLMELKNKVKIGQYNKKKMFNKSNEADNTTKKKNVIKPRFKRLPGESDKQFKYRIDCICRDTIQEVAFEDKYNVKIKRNEKGEVEGVEKRPPDELEILRKRILKEKKSKPKKGKHKVDEKPEEKKLTKSQKWALKKAQKKQNKLLEQQNETLSTPRLEQVKFGEVVHAPPVLIQPKIVSKREGAPRPGEKALLLKNILDDKDYAVPHNEQKVKVKKVIDKKGKRKHLPVALRRQLDKQQKEIIEAYKKLKRV